ncbi:MAG TPA: alanine:cation symporter family protein, partial [Gammaproteobacteria bacterium]|nr:alanine:cation symporter family protein [Gammaproteobacteria bacterium]
RLVWVAGILLGSVASLELIWNLADITLALMAFPNLLALLLLSPVVLRVSREYFQGEGAG